MSISSKRVRRLRRRLLRYVTSNRAFRYADGKLVDITAWAGRLARVLVPAPLDAHLIAGETYICGRVVEARARLFLPQSEQPSDEDCKRLQRLFRRPPKQRFPEERRMAARTEGSGAR